MTFKFRLAAVLRFRERLKDERQAELRALNLEQARRQAEIADLEARLAAADSQSIAQVGQVISPAELKIHDEFAQSLARRIEQRCRELTTFALQVEAKRGELVEAARAVKSLELLRARDEDAQRQHDAAAEQKFLDEVAQRATRQ
jgi:flagellar export protein FliJ